MVYVYQISRFGKTLGYVQAHNVTEARVAARQQIVKGRVALHLIGTIEAWDRCITALHETPDRNGAVTG
jgi:hypothetical protein